MSCSPRNYRRKHNLPPPGNDLLFPDKNILVIDAKAENYMTERPRTPEEYIAEFNRINHLKE